MKVLFAVSNEEISESIVKKYQKEYKQIISYKNVYYFNAILKELQKDKSYDRVVISEDLEAFTHTQYDQIDKFIFEKLDSISDEASNAKGNDTPIILICSDRRTKSEAMLVKLFGIGIYNAIIGTDRSVDEVCNLINRPRGKKEAKAYYKIDTDDVNYQAESENDVSEMEIQNIIAHYKRLGKNEDRYIESFNNIAAQYNDTQLRIITKFLPLNVRAVLEERSQKYQQIMSFNNTISNNLRKTKDDVDEGPSQILLKSQNKDKILSKPVVIPSSVNMDGVKKLAKPKKMPVQDQNRYVVENNMSSINQQSISQQPQQPLKQQHTQQQSQQQHVQQQSQQGRMQKQYNVPVQQQYQQPVQEIDEIEEEVVQPVKKGRGRPKKSMEGQNQSVKRGRGRPKKDNIVPIQENDEEDFVMPGLDEEIQNNNYINQDEEDGILPGMETMSMSSYDEDEEDMVLPGLEAMDSGSDYSSQNEEVQQDNYNMMNNNEYNTFNNANDINNNNDEYSIDNNMGYNVNNNMYNNSNNTNYDNNVYNNSNNTNYDNGMYNNNNTNYDGNMYGGNTTNYNNTYNDGNTIYSNNSMSTNEYTDTNVESIDLSNLLTSDRKIATFIGTGKNGTSFIVNNIAALMSSIGIDTAILDATQNKNSYYIYTKNEEPLREIAAHSIEGLAQGTTRGISVNKNLTVYTSLPAEGEAIKHVDKILETLLMKHSLILIDADFETPVNYFKQTQEIYLVQTMDVLTIQPLTAFLKKLKVKDILDEKKLRIILNKAVHIKGIKNEVIIGGMSCYNDPAMSFMTELFDRDRIKYVTIPFEDETYIKYLEGVIDCEISLKGYSKIFLQSLKDLGNMVYPIITTAPVNSRNYQPPSVNTNGRDNFSSSMNNTLDRMKRNY